MNYYKKFNLTRSQYMFYANYLRVQFLGDAAGSDKLRGTGGNSIATGLTVHFTGEHGGAGNQNAPSVIQPLEPARAILEYLPSRQTAAIQYENAANGSRLVYFAFGLEGIAGPRAETAATLFLNTLTWLAGNTTAITEEALKDAGLPEAFSLAANYPNHFNPETRIKFTVPVECFVSLKIYNLLGEEVRVLVEENVTAGAYQVRWNGRDQAGHSLSSGVYFYRLEAENFRQTNKMLLVR